MGRVNLGLSLDAQLAQDRYQHLAETAYRILRLPHIDNAKAVLSFACNVSQKALDGPV